jgi:hypothetical protein
MKFAEITRSHSLFTTGLLEPFARQFLLSLASPTIIAGV